MVLVRSMVLVQGSMVQVLEHSKVVVLGHSMAVELEHNKVEALEHNMALERGSKLAGNIS